jgi:hypothetical protein
MQFIDITMFYAAEGGGVSTCLKPPGNPGRAPQGQQLQGLEDRR